MKYDEFITKARKKHGDRYSYPVFDISRATEKITIICPEHGEFQQSVYAHLKGQGCPKCSRNQNLTTEEFIKRAKAARGDEYDYSKTVYVNKRTKVCVIDREGNEIWIYPMVLCKPHKERTKTAIRRYKTTQDFIDYVSQVHNNKYDYSKTVYKGSQKKITIICPEHGEFQQIANNHAMGHGCPKCSNTCKFSTEEFVQKANKVHNNKYDYSKTEYTGNNQKVTIICPEHGEFQQNAQHHLAGHGCPKCSKNKRLGNEEFIKRAQKIHHDRYNYDKVDYTNLALPVTITCPTHGDFKQLPSVHLTGGGCPLCNESHLESLVYKYLTDNNIKYIQQYKTSWLKRQSLDFYLPEYNVAIECQGVQHFQNIEFFNNTFEYCSTMDINKYKLCQENNIKLFYLLPNTKVDLSKVNNQYPIYNKSNTFLTIKDLIEKVKETD